LPNKTSSILDKLWFIYQKQCQFIRRKPNIKFWVCTWLHNVAYIYMAISMWLLPFVSDMMAQTFHFGNELIVYCHSNFIAVFEGCSQIQRLELWENIRPNEQSAVALKLESCCSIVD
jgi:hypothetical protein